MKNKNEIENNENNEKQKLIEQSPSMKNQTKNKKRRQKGERVTGNNSTITTSDEHPNSTTIENASETVKQ